VGENKISKRSITKTASNCKQPIKNKREKERV
jgi:hypothetical protein